MAVAVGRMGGEWRGGKKGRKRDAAIAEMFRIVGILRNISKST